MVKYLKIKNKKKFKIFFILSGTHLSKYYGNSEKLIKNDLTIYKKIKLNLKDSSINGITLTFERLFSKFRKF